MPNLTARSVIVAAVLGLLSLAGCEEKDTAAEFEKVKVGMTLSQVEGVMGSGTDETASAGYGVSGGGVMGAKATAEKTYVWKEGAATYVVVFDKDMKVVQKTKQ